MAEYFGRRGAEKVGVLKRGTRPITRDSSKISDEDTQLCNRIGCSGRSNSARSTRNVSLDKKKVLKPSSSRCSEHGKEMTVNSSKVATKGIIPVKQFRGHRNNSPSDTASYTSRSNSSSDIQEADIATSSPSSPALIDQIESQSDESTLMEIGSHSIEPTFRPKKTFLKKPTSAVGSIHSGSRASGVSKSSPQLSRPNACTPRPGLRYLRCSSVPVVSASDSATSTRKPLLKKRSSEGESSSSSRAKQPTVAENTHTLNTRSAISISDTRPARRSQTSFMDNVSASVRTRRSDPSTSTSRNPSQMSQHDPSTDQRMRRLPYSLSATSRPHRAQNSSRPNLAESSHSRNLSGPSEVSLSSTLTDHEGFRHYNISGIAEVLLALDQIEHDEEISFEQLMALESNLFLNGLSFHDQHRDMRLDIDGMSYEELLALEERIGSVSTALSEEAIYKSISKSEYNPKSLRASFSDSNRNENDTKCSICQEEYDIGDEMGRLHCEHSFHVECIDQWLRQKNWCPICKSSAASSST